MWQAIALVAIFVALAAAGLLFVNHNLYKDFEGKDPVVQVTPHRHALANMVQQTHRCFAMQALFAAVFALSANLLLLILSEILGIFSHRSVNAENAWTRYVLQPAWHSCTAVVAG